MQRQLGKNWIVQDSIKIEVEEADMNVCLCLCVCWIYLFLSKVSLETIFMFSKMVGIS